MNIPFVRCATLLRAAISRRRLSACKAQAEVMPAKLVRKVWGMQRGKAPGSAAEQCDATGAEHSILECTRSRRCSRDRGESSLILAWSCRT